MSVSLQLGIFCFRYWREDRQGCGLRMSIFRTSDCLHSNNIRKATGRSCLYDRGNDYIWQTCLLCRFADNTLKLPGAVWWDSSFEFSQESWPVLHHLSPDWVVLPLENIYFGWNPLWACRYQILPLWRKKNFISMLRADWRPGRNLPLVAESTEWAGESQSKLWVPHNKSDPYNTNVKVGLVTRENMWIHWKLPSWKETKERGCPRWIFCCR